MRTCNAKELRPEKSINTRENTDKSQEKDNGQSDSISSPKLAKWVDGKSPWTDMNEKHNAHLSLQQQIINSFTPELFSTMCQNNFFLKKKFRYNKERRRKSLYNFKILVGLQMRFFLIHVEVVYHSKHWFARDATLTIDLQGMQDLSTP